MEIKKRRDKTVKDSLARIENLKRLSEQKQKFIEDSKLKKEVEQKQKVQNDSLIQD
jgi:hypothetical protein